jgi:hypothetical protein
MRGREGTEGRGWKETEKWIGGGMSETEIAPVFM